MIIRMLVSVSRSDGFAAQIGQEIDLPDDEAGEMLDDGRAKLVYPNDDAPEQPAIEPGQPADVESGTIDLADGVSPDEATLAGKTLRRKRDTKAGE